MSHCPPHGLTHIATFVHVDGAVPFQSGMALFSPSCLTWGTLFYRSKYLNIPSTYSSNFSDSQARMHKSLPGCMHSHPPDHGWWSDTQRYLVPSLLRPCHRRSWWACYASAGCGWPYRFASAALQAPPAELPVNTDSRLQVTTTAMHSS